MGSSSFPVARLSCGWSSLDGASLSRMEVLEFRDPLFFLMQLSAFVRLLPSHHMDLVELLGSCDQLHRSAGRRDARDRLKRFDR